MKDENEKIFIEFSFQTMHKIFKKESKKSKKDRLIISLAVAAGKLLVKQGYDVPVLCQ